MPVRRRPLAPSLILALRAAWWQLPQDGDSRGHGILNILSRTISAQKTDQGIPELGYETKPFTTKGKAFTAKKKKGAKKSPSAAAVLGQR